MSIHCRTCGEPIYHLNPRNLFKHENEDIRQNIHAITGIQLFYDAHLPTHICSCCYLDLNHAISFRERCLETNNNLLDVRLNETRTRGEFHSGHFQIDPLDEHDLSEEEEIMKFNEKFHSDSPKTVKYSSPEENKKNKEGQELSSSSHLSPRVRIMRCRDPNDARQTVTRPIALLSKRPPTNARQPLGSATHPASGSRFVAVRPTAAIAPRPTTKITRPAVDNRHLPRPRRDIVRKLKEKEKKNRKPHVAPQEKRYVCDQCGWSFRDLSNMKDHRLRHSGVKKFECQECCSKFFTRPLLMLHVRVHHKGEKPFVCKYCGMAFRNSPSRCRHERKFHAQELPFECNICSNTFISKISLEKHKNIHVTGETIHRCETCKKTFKGATYLKNHYLTKFHQRKINMTIKDNYDAVELTTASDEDIDLDFSDFIIEEIDE